MFVRETVEGVIKFKVSFNFIWC